MSDPTAIDKLEANLCRAQDALAQALRDQRGVREFKWGSVALTAEPQGPAEVLDSSFRAPALWSAGVNGALLMFTRTYQGHMPCPSEYWAVQVTVDAPTKRVGEGASPQEAVDDLRTKLLTLEKAVGGILGEVQS